MNCDSIYLRELSIDDCDIIAKLANNVNIANNTLSLPYPYTIDDAHTWLKYQAEQFENDQAYNYAIIRREDNLLIGVIGISNERANRGELGYWIGEPYWNQGFASAAANLLIEYAFTDLNYNRIYARYISSNLASGRVMEKVGMKFEGVLREHEIKNEKYVDITLYAILKTEYA